MALPESLQSLIQPAAYAHSCADIELIETHISWVLLTGDYVYKLKKPVTFSFLDFGTLEQREHFCREELRCNAIFAPDLYLGVVPVVLQPDGLLRIGGDTNTGDVIEWAVKMRQFDSAMQLDRLLERGGVTLEMLASFGQSLAKKHAELPRLTDAVNEIDTRVFSPVRDNFTEIAATSLQPDDKKTLIQTRELSDALGQRLQPLIKERMRDGYLRECHGDLHLSNLVLIDQTVTAFDCLEFNSNLRWIDTINDIAFLFMDCCERDRDDLAYAFLDQYLNASGDYSGVRLLGYFAAYRSMVRAKVAALRWQQDQDRNVWKRFLRHLEWAKERLDRPPGALLLMCGLSRAGKSQLAERLAPQLPAIRLRSDVARKTLSGLGPLANTDSPVGEGLYHPNRSEEAFTFVADIAEALVLGGEHVIIDATFIEKSRRVAFLSLAEKLNVEARVLYCKAPIDVIRQRIETGSKSKQDPSEANLTVLEAQLKKFQPPGSDEPVMEIATDKPISDARLQSLVAALIA